MNPSPAFFSSPAWLVVDSCYIMLPFSCDNQNAMRCIIIFPLRCTNVSLLLCMIPLQLLKWELKQKPGMSPPRGGFNPDDPNQQIVAEDIFDEYGGICILCII